MSQTQATSRPLPMPEVGAKGEVKAIARGRAHGRRHLEKWLNQSGIYPTEFNVLVLPDPADDTVKTASGVKIYKPVDTVDKEEHASQTGTLIAVSPLAFRYDDWPQDARKPKIGDKVIFAKYSGFKRRGKDGKDYRICKDKDLVATFIE